MQKKYAPLLLSIKEKCFKELKKILLQQKYPKSKIESTILKAKETPMEVLRQPRTTKNVEIISFIAIYNPNNLKLFSIINQTVQGPTFFRKRDLLTI